MQNSVDSVPDAQIVFQRFDVNISGALCDGFPNDLVNEFHHGRLRVVSIQLNCGVSVLEHVHGTSGLQNLIERFRTDSVECFHRAQELRPWHKHPFGRFLQKLSGKLATDGIKKIIRRQHDRVFLRLDRQNVMLKYETARQDR